MENSRKVYILLLIILIIAAFFRFYKLAEIPPGLYPDVAINGNDAINALKTGEFKVFYPENNGREGLFINFIALSFSLFGISVWAIKIVPAIIGLFTVLGLYLMTKNLFLYIVCHSRESGNPVNKQNIDSRFRGNDNACRNDWKYKEIIALLSTFFLSISFWHVNFSRLGFRAIMVPFILVWGFFFLFRAIQLKNKNFLTNTDATQNTLYIILSTSYFILSGLIFGLGFHTYISFRIAPLIIGVVFLIEAWNLYQAKKASQNNAQLSVISYQSFIFSWLLFFIAIIIAASPMIIYFYNNPSDFMGRTGQVSVLASAQPIKELSISIIKSLGMFNFWGDCNWRHNYACKPALPMSVGLLFLFGFFRCLGEIIRAVYYKYKGDFRENEGEKNNWSFAQISFFLMIWFFAMLLPEILTNEGLPHSLRSIGAIPVVYIFAGIGGWWIYEEIKKQKGKIKNIGKIIFIAFLIWLPFYSYNLYFIQWGKNPEVKGAFTQNLVDIGNYPNSLPKNTKKYVIANEGGVPVPYPDGLPMPAQTVIFTEQTASQNQNTIYFRIDEIPLLFQLLSSEEKNVVVILMKYDENILNELKQKNPRGEIKEVNGIWSFIIN